MKRKFLLTLSLIVALFFVVISCGKKESTKENSPKEVEKVATATDTPIRVAAIKGPPAMGFVKLFADNENGQTTNKYTHQIVATPDEIVALVAKGEVDIASVPSNLASVLYNKTGGKIQVASLFAQGILYVVENGETVKSVADLKGKTIYANGKGATPEVVLNYILKGNGLDPEKDVTIEFKAEPTEVVAALASNPKGVALLNQPFVTVAQTKNPKLKIAFSIADEWDKVPNTKAGSQIAGVVIVNKEFAEKNGEKVSNFLKEYENSIKYLKENVDESAKLLAKYEILPEPVAKKAIPVTDIKFIAGNEMKEKVSEYLRILHSENPKIVGGKLPDDGFYYIGK